MIKLCIKVLGVAAVFHLVACTGVPDGITPVDNFEKDRYLGTWYEIARLDHGFEENLTAVTAQYKPRDKGGITVINRGYNTKKARWEQQEGKAFFVDDDDIGHLKVSFFGPFYGSYVVFALDKKNYDHALVTGPSRKYLWILARQPTLSKATLERLEGIAREQGFNTDELIYVDHDRD